MSKTHTTPHALKNLKMTNVKQFKREDYSLFFSVLKDIMQQDLSPFRRNDKKYDIEKLQIVLIYYNTIAGIFFGTLVGTRLTQNTLFVFQDMSISKLIIC